MFRTTIDDDRLAASVFVRVTYQCSHGRLTPSAEQTWGVSPGPWECDYGKMESDDVFIKGGVDFIVFGHARAPKGRVTHQMDVAVQINEELRRVLVFGDRVWQRRGRQIVPSEPKPFEAIPLSSEYAFGGKDKWDGLDVPFPANPDGKGFYISIDAAVGNLLPNIEDPNDRIREWNDQPAPAGVAVCPPGHPKRIENLVFDERGVLKELRPAFYNAAFPDMIFPSVRPGDRVTIWGVRADGPMQFVLPAAHLVVRLQFDHEVIERSPAIDQIGVEPDRDRVFVSYRYPFRYVLYPLQKRSCELKDSQ
jgi:hypothetical protein